MAGEEEPTPPLFESAIAFLTEIVCVGDFEAFARVVVVGELLPLVVVVEDEDEEDEKLLKKRVPTASNSRCIEESMLLPVPDLGLLLLPLPTPPSLVESFDPNVTCFLLPPLLSSPAREAAALDRVSRALLDETLGGTVEEAAAATVASLNIPAAFKAAKRSENEGPACAEDLLANNVAFLSLTAGEAEEEAEEALLLPIPAEDETRLGEAAWVWANNCLCAADLRSFAGSEASVGGAETIVFAAVVEGMLLLVVVAGNRSKTPNFRGISNWVKSVILFQ